MTKILIIKFNGMYTSHCEDNRGSAGVASATIQLLRQCIPDAEFTSLIQFSEEFANKQGIKVIQNKISAAESLSLGTVVKSSLDVIRCALWALMHKLFPRASKSLINNTVLKAYADTDVIIDMSMDLYSQDYIGALPVVEHSKEILLGILLKKPVVIWAQSPGPFKSKLVAWLVRFTLNRVALILIREEISLANIQKLGVTRPPIHLTADPAFLLEPASPERGREILFKEGFRENNRPLMGLALGWNNINWRSGAKWYRRYLRPIYRFLMFFLPERLYGLVKKQSKQPAVPHISSYTQIEEAAKIVDFLVTELNANVVLVPHDYSISGDERIVLGTILNRVTHRDGVRVLTGEYSAPELKAVIGQCDLFIGGKMHANIAATSIYVPTVAIQYYRHSQKFNGIMRLLGQEKYVCEHLTLNEVRAKVREVWSERQRIRLELKARMEVIKERARDNAARVIDLLNSGRYHVS